jgi:hypothetical protein
LEPWSMILKTWIELLSTLLLPHQLGDLLPCITCEIFTNEVGLVENQSTQLWQRTIVPVLR